ncbi:MAG: PAS domain-containing protein [Chthoniobacterales bacterium]
MKSGFLEKLLERIQHVQAGDVQNYLIDLAREKGFLETIFNVILEGVIVTNPKGRIVYLNRSACAFFGLDQEESLGKVLSEVVRGLDLK